MAEPTKRVIFSHDTTEIQYDSLGNVASIPLDFLQEVTQISRCEFFVKDTSNNFGYVNMLATDLKNVDAFIEVLSAYIIVFEYTETPVEKIVLSEPIDFTSTGTTTIPVPTGYIFFCDEVGVIAEDADTVTIFPNIEWGVDGDTDYYALAQDAYSLLAPNDRYRQTTMLQSKGETVSLEAVINTGATAASLTGRFYFKGFYLRNTAALP